VKYFPYESSSTFSLFHPDQKHIISSHQNGAIRVINIEEDHVVTTFFPELEVAVQSLTIDSTGKYLFATTYSGNGYLYNIESLSTENYPLLKTWVAHSTYILSLQISSNNKLLSTCSADKFIKLWDLKDTDQDFIKAKTTLRGHQRWVWDSVFTKSNTHLISVSSDALAILWDVDLCRPIRKFSGGKPMTSIALRE